MHYQEEDFYPRKSSWWKKAVALTLVLALVGATLLAAIVVALGH